MPRGYGSESIRQVGIIIRDLLLEKGEAYGQELHKLVKEETGRKKSSYSSFSANYIHTLLKLGMIERTRREPSSVPGFVDRQYWSLTPGAKDLMDIWRDPQGAWNRLRRKAI
ncbi:hypothetical protein LCGC14_1061690 [marine sediment metagenome]|uniref:Transcription regulator PadR N-terminal domain-containing protein n=1 Tax=marine sediment metagenome TaxID=412755 RepID=A0A0F9ML04_9ZZZZ